MDIAFFFHNSELERVVAFYPSPVGATESQLGLEAWEELECANPVIGEMEPDVEALLVNRARGARDHWLVPIDDCYDLVGLMRTRWRGLSGGKEVWEEIGRFFERLERRARPWTGRRANDIEPGGGDMADDVTTGEATGEARRPSHMKGIKQGNSRGNYEKWAVTSDGTSTPSARPGSTRRARTRSTRDAEPLARVADPCRHHTSNGALARIGSPDLAFAVEGLEAEPFAAVPTLVFKLGSSGGRRGGPVDRAEHADPGSRPRSAPTATPGASALELFGAPEQWARSLRSFPWTT